MIPGIHPPGGVADGWMGVGVSMGVWGMSHSCIHAHTCTRMHAHTYMLNMLNMLNRCLHVGGHLQFLYMYKCACVHVCACPYMCVCVGTPPMPPDAPHHLPPPQSRREPKTPKFNKSWTNQDNSILFGRFFTSEHSWTHIDYSWSPRTPPTHLPHPPEPRKPKSEELH